MYGPSPSIFHFLAVCLRAQIQGNLPWSCASIASWPETKSQRDGLTGSLAIIGEETVKSCQIQIRKVKSCQVKIVKFVSLHCIKHELARKVAWAANPCPQVAASMHTSLQQLCRQPLATAPTRLFGDLGWKSWNISLKRAEDSTFVEYLSIAGSKPWYPGHLPNSW